MMWFAGVLFLTTTLAFIVTSVVAEDDASMNHRPPPRPGKPAAISRAIAAVEAMMSMYDTTTGRWQTQEPWWQPDNSAWWQSGNALQALLDFLWKGAAAISNNGSGEYFENVKNTIQKQRQTLPWWPQGNGEFRASSTDDTGWWALALTRAFDLTQNTTYLDVAGIGEAYMRSYWDDVCGGGIYWDADPVRYKNAISIQLLMKLQAALHNRIPGDEMYLAHALDSWNWFNGSGMINENNLVNDGLDDETCQNNQGTTWTYNQGVILGALSELYLATTNVDLINVARQIADAVIASPDLSPNGILTEPCEKWGTASTATLCNSDQASFKGIFARNLGELNGLLIDNDDDRPYSWYLRNQAFSLYVNGRNGSDFYGLSWAGPFDASSVSISTQNSAVSLLTAVLDGITDNNSRTPQATTIFLSPPQLRYTPWKFLDGKARDIAQNGLLYNEMLWNFPGSAIVETMLWETLTSTGQLAATDLGFDKDTWNCYQNHYRGYNWTELAELQVQEYWAILGWTTASWDGDGVPPESQNKSWAELTPIEAGAAHDVCFSNYTWGNQVVSLEDWPVWQVANVTAMPSASPIMTNNGTTLSPTAGPTVLLQPTTSSPTAMSLQPAKEVMSSPTAPPPASNIMPTTSPAASTTSLEPSAVMSEAPTPNYQPTASPTFDADLSAASSTSSASSKELFYPCFVLFELLVIIGFLAI